MHFAFIEHQRWWKTLSLTVSLALLCFAIASGQPERVSFEGWEGDTTKTFRLEQGAVVGGTLAAKIPRNEFLCTQRSYKNLVLRLKFKVLGEGANAGVQIRSKRIPNHH